MNYQDLTSTPEFRRLHPVKQQIIRELMQSNPNMSPEFLMPKMMMLNKELSKRNLSFSREETTLLINIMKEYMSPNERQKVDMLLGLFHQG
ncbi:MAG: hypothetical protein NC300_11975 [Bacteroidales bacterium]|nr:hypothetical protein [Clostridium sp.]MCM1204849.1 hypothetical protein [Bacteroidales bacterium]